MVNKCVILPEIDLPLRNSLLTNTSERGKVLTGTRYPNHVRIQKVPRSLSRKRALQNFPLTAKANDLGHENSRTSPIREETHSFPRRVNHDFFGETHSFPHRANHGLPGRNSCILGPPHHVWDRELLHHVLETWRDPLGIVDNFARSNDG